PFSSLMDVFYKLFKMDIYNSIDIYKQYFNFIDKNGENGFIIKYEDFIDRKLDKLSEYLGFDISDNDDVGDALSRTVRSKAYNNWKHLFTQKDIPIMKQKFNANLLAKYDYTDWSLDENPVFAPSEGSLYIKNLILDAIAKNNA
ncbi:MAG: hypothetical protein QG565_334, partial [Campylobacterota bacterium]|nr:hypothetical protein [Campylobacterota bacterium]